MTAHDVDVQLAWEPSIDVKAADAYLREVVDRLTHLAPDIVIHTRVHVGELVDQIRALDAAAVAGTEPPIALIAIATHGRTGLSQALLGSTAHDVLRASDHPLVGVTRVCAARPQRVLSRGQSNRALPYRFTT